MLIPYIALTLLIVFLILGFYLMINTIMLVYSLLNGAPYVKTRAQVIRQILKEAQIKKDAKLIDLGCGDGIVVRIAAQEYGLEATGIDVNFLLIARARIINRIQHLNKIKYIQQNVLDTDISQADILYIFLLPQFLRKFRNKLKNESKKDALIISHGFQIDGWDSYKIKTIKNKPFSTFFYKITRDNA